MALPAQDHQLGQTGQSPKPKEMTKLQEVVLRVVRLIPPGKVLSYGQVAAYIGAPRSARQVGWAMRSLEGTPDFPWWRVLNNSGQITIKGNQFSTAQLQKELLQAEGVKVDDKFQLDMSHYRFRPTAAWLRALQLDHDYIQAVLTKYGIE